MTIANKAETPGPGQYSPKTEISKTGEYFLSRFKNTGAAALYKSRRETLNVMKDTRYGPGPGSYLLPSDFGYPFSAHKSGKKHRRSTSQI